MISTLALLLTLATAPNRTEWMRLESFHLSIGMERAAAVEALKAWDPKKGKTPDEVVVDYDGEKAITLEFRNGRLQSARFELFVLLPEIRTVFEEERRYLLEVRGKPRKETRSILIYDTALPNVMVVAGDDPNSEQGKKGVGVLAVRYYDPR